MRLMFSARMPKSAASACSSQVPLRPQVRQLLGWVERSSSSTVRRMSVSSPLWVVMSMPSIDGRAAGAGHARLAGDLDDAQAAGGGRQQIFVLAERRDLDLHLAGGFEDRRAGGDGDRQAVDLDVDLRRSGGVGGGRSGRRSGGGNHGGAGSGVGGFGGGGLGGAVRGHLARVTHAAFEVGLELGFKVAQGGEHRVGGGLPEAAERGLLHGLARWRGCARRRLFPRGRGTGG